MSALIGALRCESTYIVGVSALNTRYLDSSDEADVLISAATAGSMGVFGGFFLLINATR